MIKTNWYNFYKLGKYSFSLSRSKDTGLIWEFCPWYMPNSEDWIHFNIGGFVILAYSPGYLTVMGLSFFIEP